MAIKTSSQSLLSRGSTTTAISGFGGGGTTSSGSITINSVVYLAANGTPLIANAAPTTGNSVIKIVGSGFALTSNVYLNGLLQPAAALTFIDSTEFRLNMPVLTSNTYSLMIFNSSTAGAIYYQGVRFDPYPIWSTGSYVNTSASINVQLLVTGYGSGTVTFGVSSGNTLPSGVTLSSSGLLSGTVTQSDATSIYNFYVDAIDSENEITTQQISLTVNINDPYFYLNSTTLNFERTANSTTNFNIVDSSNNNYTVTTTSYFTQGSQNPFGFGTWSMDFSNSMAYATTPASANLNIGTANFTVEAWVYPFAFGDVASGYAGNIRGVFSFGDANYFGLNTSGVPVYQGTAFGSTAISTYAWTHIAWSRVGSTLTCYVNGTSIGTQSVSSSIGNSSTKNTMGGHSDTYYFYGYISNLRVLNGTGLYTGNFTTPTLPLSNIANTQLLVCQASSFRDSSNNNFAVTRRYNLARSAANVPNIIRFNPFGVSGNAYSVSANATYHGSMDFTYGNYNAGLTVSAPISCPGEFTWECYAYVPYIPSSIGWLQFNLTEGPYRWGGWVTTDGTVQANLYGSGNQGFTGAGAVITGAWSHYAFTRDGTGTVRFFRDGVVLGSTSIGNQYGSQLGNGTGVYLNGPGITCDVKFYQGVCLYASAFTPTWQPLENSNNPTIFLKGTNGVVYDHTLLNNYRLVNATSNTTVIKNGTASIGFTGSSSYMYSAVASSSSGTQSYLNRDFTVEAWVYFNTVASAQPIMAYGTSGASSQLLFSLSNTLGLRWNFSGATTDINQGSASGWTTGTWYHVAATRVGTQITLWKNGANVASGTASTSYGGVDLYVGGSTGDSLYMNGNIDDFRITNGQARYTTTFSPPTSITLQ